MKSITVIAYQSLLDLAIEYSGSVLSVMELAVLNNLDITAELTPGQIIFIPEFTNPNADVIQYFKGKGQKIATDIRLDETIVPELEGIDYWAIGFDFVVQ